MLPRPQEAMLPFIILGRLQEAMLPFIILFGFLQAFPLLYILALIEWKKGKEVCWKKRPSSRSSLRPRFGMLVSASRVERMRED